MAYKEKLYEKIVEAVKADSLENYNNWKAHTGCAAEDFLDGVKWLIDVDWHGHPANYALGCSPQGEIVKLRCSHTSNYDGYWTTTYRLDGKPVYPHIFRWDFPSINISDIKGWRRELGLN